MDIIIVNDMNLALLLRENLTKSGNRNPMFDPIRDYRKFTLEELKTIKSLKLEYQTYTDISVLEHCTNLKELVIKSKNPKQLNTMISSDALFNYELARTRITDFRVISKLKNLQFLTIEFNDNLKSLDLTGLTNLTVLSLTYNPNLQEIKGLETLTGLSELTLYRNNLNHTIDLESLINFSLSIATLDFDLYPDLLKRYPNILETIQDKSKYGFTCKWAENVSNITVNMISTPKMNQLHKKAQEIIDLIIDDDYSDIEKISAIYAYIIGNVTYDEESLKAANGEQNETRIKATNNLSERVDDVLLKRQSSYNAIIEKKAVCEGYVNMMHYLLKLVGIESMTCSCSSEFKASVVGSDSNHAVIKVKFRDKWYYFDPTWDTYGENLQNFFKTKNEFNKNHTLSISEKNTISPMIKPYTNEELTKILLKVINDCEKKLEKIERVIK